MTISKTHRCDRHVFFRHHANVEFLWAIDWKMLLEYEKCRFHSKKLSKKIFGEHIRFFEIFESHDVTVLYSFSESKIEKLRISIDHGVFDHFQG